MRFSVSPVPTLLFLFSMSLAAVGCAATMQDVERKLEPGAGYALVTFLRPEGYSDPSDFSLWDRDKLIGVLNHRRMIQVKLEPGKHLFVAHCHNWSLVAATLEAGRHYYIVGKVYPGEWGAQVALYPVNEHFVVDDAELAKWMRTLKRARLVPEQRQPYQVKNQDRVRAKVQQYDEGQIGAEEMSADDYR